jgi:hypothetical protein
MEGVWFVPRFVSSSSISLPSAFIFHVSGGSLFGAVLKPGGRMLVVRCLCWNTIQEKVCPFQSVFWSLSNCRYSKRFCVWVFTKPGTDPQLASNVYEGIVFLDVRVNWPTRKVEKAVLLLIHHEHSFQCGCIYRVFHDLWTLLQEVIS